MALYGGNGGGSPLLGGLPLNRSAARNVLLAMQGRMGRRAAPMGGPHRADLQELFQALPQHVPTPDAPPLSRGSLGEGGLMPLPMPLPQINPGALRAGLIDLLHPAMRNVAGQRLVPPRPGKGSIPQNSLRIAIPSAGPFHHNASVQHGMDKRAQLAQFRHQHVTDAQAQASQMTNMIRKGRARGVGQPRRAVYMGY